MNHVQTQQQSSNIQIKTLFRFIPPIFQFSHNSCLVLDRFLFPASFSNVQASRASFNLCFKLRILIDSAFDRFSKDTSEVKSNNLLLAIFMRDSMLNIGACTCVNMLLPPLDVFGFVLPSFDEDLVREVEIGDEFSLKVTLVAHINVFGGVRMLLMLFILCKTSLFDDVEASSLFCNSILLFFPMFY